MRATDWLSIGKVLPKPAEGCIVVFSRAGGGHVGFVVGKSASGNLMVLGGNQGDAVRISEFSFGSCYRVSLAVCCPIARAL